jgi:membrane-anchored protein YejM (alkaline phosphatase superfamily)
VHTTEARTFNLFALLNTLFLCLLALPFLLNILQSQSLFQNNIIHYQHIGSKAFIVSFAIINYLSFLGLLALLPRLLLCFVPKKWLFQAPLLIALYSFLVLLIIADRLLYKNYQFHLNLELFSLLKASLIHRVFELSLLEQGLLLSVVIIILLTECCALWLCRSWARKNIKRLQTFSLKKMLLIPGLSLSFCLCFLGLSLIHQNPILLQQTQHIPFYQPTFRLLMSKELNRAINLVTNQGIHLPAMDASTLDYPKAPLNCRQNTPPMNLVILLVDALRFDAVNQQTMPHLNKLANEMSSFGHYYSGGNATQPGLFSLFYGLPPNDWPSVLSDELPPPLHTQLKEQGYESLAIWSAQFKAPPFDKTILKDLDKAISTHSRSDKVKDWDKQSTLEAIQFIKEAHAKPFYLQVFYRAPHAYCYAEEFNAPFQPIASPCQRVFKHKIKHEYYNRYKNAVHFIDQEIAKVIATLKQGNLWQNSVVIISSDHGEEFDDNNLGYWGHTSNFSKYQTQVPLLLHWPGRTPQTIDTQKSHYDLNATLLKDLANCQNPSKEIGLGTNLFDSKTSLPLWLASYNNFGLMTENKIITLSHQGQLRSYEQDGREVALNDLDKKTLEHALNDFRRFHR